MLDSTNKNMINQIILEPNFMLAIKIITIIMTSILNGFLIVVFTFLTKRKQFSDLIFISIALSDFLNGVLTMTSQTVLDMNENKWPFSRQSCLFFVFVQYAMPDTTLLSVVVLSINRYLQMKNLKLNSKYEKINFFNLTKLIGVWVFASIFWINTIICMIYLNQFSFDRCDIEPSFIYKISKVLIFGLIPLVLIIYLNVLSMNILNQNSKKFLVSSATLKRDESFANLLPSTNIENKNIMNENKTSLITSTNSNKKQLSKYNKMSMKNTHLKTKYKKAIVCILAVTLSIFLTQIVYLISWPIYLLHCVEANQLIELAYRCGVWLTYLNSLTNPIIVIIFHQKVRKILFGLICTNKKIDSS